jgi:hypothetical protein
MREFEKKGWFRIRVPDDWQIDEDEEPLAIYHAEGPGALQITVQDPLPLKPGERLDVFLMLRAYLHMTGVDIDSIDARRSSERGMEWAVAEYPTESPEGEDLVIRVWMVTNHGGVIFLTYACPSEQKDAERAAIDGIVASLELA